MFALRFTPPLSHRLVMVRSGRRTFDHRLHVLVAVRRMLARAGNQTSRVQPCLGKPRLLSSLGDLNEDAEYQALVLINRMVPLEHLTQDKKS
ncbi:hypothetical protein KC349_g304 [Hortaea werneckii]|nr:hypothetical protein KC349_g304 [Hortaea werneckii]